MVGLCLVRYNVPPNTLQVISEMGFYGSKDSTNSVTALKEDMVLRIRLRSHQVHPTVLQQYETYAVWKKRKIQTRKHKRIYTQWKGPSV